MIITKPRDVEVFEFLLANYYRDFKIGELSERTKLSIPKLYKTLNLFEKYGLIRRRLTIRIRMNNIFTHSYKLLKDAEKFMQLRDPFRLDIISARNEILVKYKNKVKSIIIFGSLASGEYNKDSDIDILLIRDDETEEFDLSFIKFEGHIIQKAESELTNDFNRGDDFLISILKNNIICYDREDIFYDLMGNLSSISERSISGSEKQMRVISERKEQLEILRKQMLEDIKKNRLQEGADNFKKYILLSSRIELLTDSLAKPYPVEHIPTTKNQTLIGISSLRKEDISSLYHSVNKNNLKKLALKHV